MRSAERRRRDRRRTSTALVCSILAVGACFALLLASADRLSTLRARQTWLVRHGVPATATVAQVINPGGEVCGHFDIQFRTSSGTTITHLGFEASPVNVDPTGNPRNGEKIRILYDPRDPTSIRTAGPSCGDPQRQWLSWAGIVVGVGGVLGALTVLVVSLRLLRSSDQAERKHGAAEPHARLG